MNIIQNTPMLMMQGSKSWLGDMLTQWLQWAPGDGRGSVGFATKKALHVALLKANLGQLAQQFSDGDHHLRSFNSKNTEEKGAYICTCR